MNNKLKAFIRLDGKGTIVPGSAVLRQRKPKVGSWRELNPVNRCCNTTTTTTTVI